jgi:hypothetical protein
MRGDTKQKQGPEPVQQLSLWHEQKQQGKEQLPPPWSVPLERLQQVQQWLRPHATLLRTWLTLVGNSYPEIFTSQRKGKKQRWSVFAIDHTVQDEEPACFRHWPSAGLYNAEAGVGIALDLPEHPRHIQGSCLWDIIEKGPVGERYFLSPHAARGMLRRADRMKRNLFPPLRQALELLASSDQGEGKDDGREELS